MNKINQEIKEKPEARFLIVNRRYYELICMEIAKKDKIKDYFMVVADDYKGLIVAITDKADFNYEIL